MIPASPNRAATRAQQNNATEHHAMVRLEVLGSQSAFLAGQNCSGQVRLTCLDSKVWLGDIKLRLTGTEELISRSHSATENFYSKSVAFQSAQVGPSNAVDPSRQQRGEFWPCRGEGKTTFDFSFPLPSHLPSSGAFSTNAQLSYVLEATANVSYAGERSLLVKKSNLRVYEAWSDWQNQHFWHSEKRDASARVDNGSVWLEASVKPTLYWRQDLAHSYPSLDGAAIPVQVAVRNTTRKKLDEIHIQLIRRLRVGARKAKDPLASLPAPQLTELVVEESMSGHRYEFNPGDEHSIMVECGLPDTLHSVRALHLFDIDVLLRVSLEVGLSKEVAVELPIFVAHPVSLPNEAHRQRSAAIALCPSPVQWSQSSIPSPRLPSPRLSSPQMQQQQDWYSQSSSPVYAPSPQPIYSSQPAPFATYDPSATYVPFDTSQPNLTASRFMAGLGLAPARRPVNMEPTLYADQSAGLTYQPGLSLPFNSSQSEVLSFSSQLVLPAGTTPPRSTSGRGNRNSSAPATYCADVVETPLPPDLSSYSPSDQAQILANLTPDPAYSSIARSRSSRRHSAPMTSQTTPPPAPSTLFFAEAENTRLKDSLFLDTIGEDGESQAGTLKGTPKAWKKQVEPEIHSTFAQQAANISGSSSANLLEHLFAEEEEEDKDMADLLRDKTLPKPPVPSGKFVKADTVPPVPRVMDIFQPLSRQSAQTTVKLPKAGSTQAMKKSNSEAALAALEQRLSRPTSPEITDQPVTMYKPRTKRKSAPVGEPSALLSRAKSMRGFESLAPASTPIKTSSYSVKAWLDQATQGRQTSPAPVGPEPEESSHVDDIRSEDSVSRIKKTVSIPSGPALVPEKETPKKRQPRTVSTNSMARQGSARDLDVPSRPVQKAVETKPRQNATLSAVAPTAKTSLPVKSVAVEAANHQSASTPKEGRVASVAAKWQNFEKQRQMEQEPQKLLKTKPHVKLIDPMATSAPLRPTSPGAEGRRINLRALHDLMSEKKVGETPRKKEVAIQKSPFAPFAKTAADVYVHKAAIKSPQLAPPSVLQQPVQGAGKRRTSLALTALISRYDQK